MTQNKITIVIRTKSITKAISDNLFSLTLITLNRKILLNTGIVVSSNLIRN